MHQGWISVHRLLQSHWLWEDRPFSKGQAWIDLLLLANHEDAKFLLGNQLVEARRGEVITSKVKLMERWGWSKTKVRSFLELLQRESMIVKKSDNKKTSINIVKYSVWQDSQTTKKPEKDHQETSKKPEKDTINNDNNLNNVNKDNKAGGNFESAQTSWSGTGKKPWEFASEADKKFYEREL